MSVDATLFGQHGLKIRCALLSHDGLGASFYGRFAVTLNAALIDQRVSLLENNPFSVPSEQVDMLRRATWSNRHKLVAVRYGDAAVKRSKEPLAIIVRVLGSARGGQEFVEAHVWGAFNSSAFEAVAAQVPVPITDARLVADVARIRELCAKRGLPFREEMDLS
jgi:hypothetical protein